MDNIAKSNVLVVGAGGIGCELLKNLVMWNFKEITVIDLDTIDVSNLNRQFLFRKENVGKSKALTAKESVLKFNPNVNIKAIHDDVMSNKYNADFFKTFDIVLNALDNKAARNYVNRMCLKSNIPLIEGGTMGYRGQVQVILKGKTACYECYPKPAQKQYPACTIRNTPSEPIHCVVWAKFLFNQLFGEPDADQDVVPDQNDPELTNETTENGDQTDPVKLNIRLAWKVSDQYDSNLLLKILFNDNIRDLLSMKALWMKSERVKPEVLDKSLINVDIDDLSQFMSNVTGGVKDQEKFSLRNWCQAFKNSANQLSERMSQSDTALVWDKDDVVAMDFVAAAANIRMSVFHILPMLTRFEIKSMAGNIIPAIATTNAMIAGISVLHAYKILNGQADKCLDVMVSDFVSGRGKIVQSVQPLSPVKDCYVCSKKLELTLLCKSTNLISLKLLKVAILENHLKMLAPNVNIQNKSSVIIDGDDDEIDEVYFEKTLDQFDVANGTVFRCSDFLQNYEFVLEIKVDSELKNDYEILGDVEHVISSAVSDSDRNGNLNSPPNSVDETADLNDSGTNVSGDRKRKHEDSMEHELKHKIAKMDSQVDIDNEDDEDDLIMVE